MSAARACPHALTTRRYSLLATLRLRRASSLSSASTDGGENFWAYLLERNHRSNVGNRTSGAAPSHTSRADTFLAACPANHRSIEDPALGSASRAVALRRTRNHAPNFGKRDSRI